MLSNIVVWVIVGGLAGWIAGKIVGKDSQMGLFANITVGVLGAIIGGFILNLFGLSGVTGFNLWSILVAILGAVILLLVMNKIRK